MREPAWRVFAGEYNEAAHVIESEEEMAPSFVVTPLGAKVNRLFLVGVLTDIENVAQEGEMWRAHISDPTGIYAVYAGQYQPEAATFFSQADTPSYVAVAGKARAYAPEEGVLFVSVRPEMVREVDESMRDYWITETSQQTQTRIEAMKEAVKMDTPSVYKLRELGYSTALSEGVVAAVSAYPDVDIQHYQFLVREALSHFSSGRIQFAEEMNEAEESILAAVQELEGENGVLWDDIVEHASSQGIDRHIVEEALTSLMDKGIIYEPILGKLKTT